MGTTGSLLTVEQSDAINIQKILQNLQNQPNIQQKQQNHLKIQKTAGGSS